MYLNEFGLDLGEILMNWRERERGRMRVRRTIDLIFIKFQNPKPLLACTSRFLRLETCRCLLATQIQLVSIRMAIGRVVHWVAGWSG